MEKQYSIMGVQMNKNEYTAIRPYINKEVKHGMHPTTDTVKGYLHTLHRAEGLTESFHGFAVSPRERQLLTFVITNEEQQGWRPTKRDIKELIKSGRHPSRHLRNKMKSFDHDVRVSRYNSDNKKRFDRFSYPNGTLKSKLGVHDSRKLAHTAFFLLTI